MLLLAALASSCPMSDLFKTTREALSDLDALFQSEQSPQQRKGLPVAFSVWFRNAKRQKL